MKCSVPISEGRSGNLPIAGVEPNLFPPSLQFNWSVRYP
ncbi:hypothetical protein D918_00501 [Trichuris suis]|nr:hypothetical protein D918_00501 [Trichuris suis]